MPSQAHIERKVAAAAVFLLLCLVLLISTSYAWFSISRVPEIRGIETHIGSNGSLEIALLDRNTYLDPSAIRNAIGDSVEIQSPVLSNRSWGNVIDLGDVGYGLTEITLLPARLNAAMGGEKQNVVADSLLTVPGFGTDGRTEFFNANLVSATYADRSFSYNTSSQNYGVRGIGTIDNITLQQTALTNARTLVPSYMAAAKSATVSMWSAGFKLANMWIRGGQGETFTDTDIAVIRDSAVRMSGALSYIDAALRQSVVGYAASVLENEADFKLLRDAVLNTAYPLSQMMAMLPVQAPSGLSGWITALDEDRMELAYLIRACDMLRGGSYPWDQVRLLVTPLLDGEQTNLYSSYYGNEWKLSEAPYMVRHPIMTLAPGAGIPATVADYCGNYSAEEETFAMQIKSASTVKVPHLMQMAQLLNQCEAAAGDTTIRETELNEIYGYAVDMAIRCNQPANLLLQTEPELRVSGTQSEDGSPSEYQGSGSFMSFISQHLSTDQMVHVMDAIRVAFVDQQNTLLGIAKLNTGQYTVKDREIAAPLYLYDYTIALDGSISIGKCRTDRSAIMTLDDDAATVLTAIVWMDGDHVDNALVSSTAHTMEGALNLQFSTDAQLHSAAD